MRAHEIGGQEEDGQDVPAGDPPDPLMRTCGSSYTHGAAYGRGAAFPMSLLTQGAPAQPCLGGALPLGGQFTPRILPPWPSDCLVLQLSLPCALGDPLAASSREPRPQTPPTLQIEIPSPNECSAAALAACTLHMLVSSTAPLARARPSPDPFPRIAGRCLQCSQRPSSGSPAGTWHCLSSP